MYCHKDLQAYLRYLYASKGNNTQTTLLSKPVGCILRQVIGQTSLSLLPVPQAAMLAAAFRLPIYDLRPAALPNVQILLALEDAL